MNKLFKLIQLFRKTNGRAPSPNELDMLKRQVSGVGGDNIIQFPGGDKRGIKSLDEFKASEDAYEQAQENLFPDSFKEEFMDFVNTGKNTNKSGINTKPDLKVVKPKGEGTLKFEEELNVNLYGDETFEELMQIKNTGKHPRDKAAGGRIGFFAGGAKGLLKILQGKLGKKTLKMADDVARPKSALDREMFDAANKRFNQKVKSRQLTKDELEDFENEIGDALEAYDFDGTAVDAERILKEQKDYMGKMSAEYKAEGGAKRAGGPKDPVKKAMDEVGGNFTGDLKYDADVLADEIAFQRGLIPEGGDLTDIADQMKRMDLYDEAYSAVSGVFKKQREIKKLSKPTQTLKSIKEKGTMDISDPDIADEFDTFLRENDPEGYKNLEQKIQLDNFDPKDRKGSAVGGRIGYGAGGITKVYQLLRGVNKTKPLRGLEEKLIKQYKSEGMEFIEAIKKAQTETGGIRYESQMKIIDDAMKDTNVYGDDYVDLLDMKIKLEDPDFGKQFKNFPENLKNKTRARNDPDWAEANFGENYNEQMDIARSKEINESIDPNFKEPLSPSDQMASDIDDMNTANVDDFFGTRKKQASGGLAYMLGEEPRSMYSGGGGTGMPAVTYGPPVQNQTQVAGNKQIYESMHQQLIREAQELEFLKRKAQGNFREEPGNMNQPIRGGIHATYDMPQGTFEGNTLSDLGQAIGDVVAPQPGIAYINTGKDYEAGIEAYPNKIGIGFRKQFAGGGLSRRAFLKLLGAGTATAAAAKTGILGLLKGKKAVAAAEVVIPTITKTAGMPDWFPGLVKRALTEGTDVSKVAKTVDGEIVKRVNIKGTDVDVRHRLDTGEVGVKVHGGNQSKIPGDDVKIGDLTTAYDEGLDMTYLPGKSPKNKLDKPKFKMEEAEARWEGNPYEPDISTVDVNTELTYSKADLKSLELFSKNKTPTFKDNVKINKKIEKNKGYIDSPGESPELKDMPEWEKMDMLGVKDRGQFQNGGLARLLGE